MDFVHGFFQLILKAIVRLLFVHGVALCRSQVHLETLQLLAETDHVVLILSELMFSLLECLLSVVQVSLQRFLFTR